MKKFGAGSLLLALAIGLVSCDHKMDDHKKDRDQNHPRRGSVSKVETKASSSIDNLKSE